LYQNVVNQWNRYTGHVLTNVGGVVQTRKIQGQDGAPFAKVPAEKQARAVAYLSEQVFATPDWMLVPDILDRIQGSGTPDLVRGRQLFALNGLLDVDRMKRLIEQEAFNGSDSYSLGQMLDDVRAGIWSEVASGRATDAYRRNLQRAYLDRMATLMEDEAAQQTDVAPFVRGQLITLRGQVQRALGRAPDRATRLHYQDVVVRIDRILDPNG
jgi:Met-zincin